MTLYELTRLLVARGCEEHPTAFFDVDDGVPYLYGKWGSEVEDDVRDLWTVHALRWWAGCRGHGWGDAMISLATRTGYRTTLTILEAIEAATRHLATR